jgi:hypothetical protein
METASADENMKRKKNIPKSDQLRQQKMPTDLERLAMNGKPLLAIVPQHL